MGIIGMLEKFLSLGGVTSYMILFSALTLIVIAFDRLTYLYFRLRPLSDAALSSLQQTVSKRDYSAALQMCNSVTDTPELEVMKAGLLAVESGREAMKSSLGASVVDIHRRCEKRIQIVALIAGVATLLGLLGTISGLIKTFVAIAAADPAKKAELLGLGISEAMTATAAGLIVGIAAMVVHTLCVSKIDEIMGQVKKAGFNLVSLIEQSERET